MVAGLVVVTLVAWVAWARTSRTYDQRLRFGAVGFLAPDARTDRGLDRDARLRPVPPQRVRKAWVSAVVWSVAVVAASITWGLTPGTFVIGFAAVLFVGDLVAVHRQRRFVEAYERELGEGR